MEFCGMKREIDRKWLNHARVHANAQLFDRCGGQYGKYESGNLSWAPFTRVRTNLCTDKNLQVSTLCLHRTGGTG